MALSLCHCGKEETDPSAYTITVCNDEDVEVGVLAQSGIKNMSLTDEEGKAVQVPGNEILIENSFDVSQHDFASTSPDDIHATKFKWNEAGQEYEIIVPGDKYLAGATVSPGIIVDNGSDIDLSGPEDKVGGEYDLFKITFQTPDGKTRHFQSELRFRQEAIAVKYSAHLTCAIECGNQSSCIYPFCDECRPRNCSYDCGSGISGEINGCSDDNDPGAQEVASAGGISCAIQAISAPEDFPYAFQVQM